MGSVTLERSEYDSLRSEIASAQQRAAELERELLAARERPDNQVIADLQTALRSAAAVVDFAVANLDPEFIKAWPWEALERLAQVIAVVGSDARDPERAMVWADHVRRIQRFEHERQLRRSAPISDDAST